MRVFPSFAHAIINLESQFSSSAYEVKTEKWQGLSTSGKPELAMYELLNTNFAVPLRGIEDLDHWKADIGPNLPFADAHFSERVSGVPSNPGEAWKIWPWGHAADKHRTENEKFTHTYQERFWPKGAGDPERRYSELGPNMHGIRYPYGDLDDVVQLLHREPLTRQAFFPIWFPEDTGVVHGGRVPCTLGYHFINRHDYLHISYYIRSCDFVRHFRDDCYFTVCLALWVLERLRRLDTRWDAVKPGLFRMDIVSLHMFVNDYIQKFGSRKK